MAGEDPKDQDPGRDDPKDQDPPEDDPKGDDPEDPPEEDPKGKPKDQDPDLKRAIQRRDRALKEKTALAEQLQKLKEKYEPEKADPVKVANRRLVTAEAKVVLTGKGFTDPGDQKALAAYLDLDSVSVTDDGDVDSDTIQDRVEELVRIVGKVAGGGGKNRTPRLDTRDRGGERAQPKDAASTRRRDMLLGR